ncbi:hypothetical protein [Portibacter marinus]|uniref:hypothetical protein n=1 Tax=Portibacter marinus TaxID=2898660 RepID=UPI001F17DAFF|nr:hypothetical protein [Portibacter marinus]
MSDSKSIALTIQAPLVNNLGARIVIGKNQLYLDSSKINLYWMVVVDRTDLSVKANFTFSTNDKVPKELNPYLNNSQYILILTTQLLKSANLPVGDFYNYLIKEGADRELKRCEQIFAALNCGNWAYWAYSYVTIMGDDTTSGFELFGFTDSTIMTLQLQPVNISGKTYYTPVDQL